MTEPIYIMKEVAEMYVKELTRMKKKFLSDFKKLEPIDWSDSNQIRKVMPIVVALAGINEDLENFAKAEITKSK